MLFGLEDQNLPCVAFQPSIIPKHSIVVEEDEKSLPSQTLCIAYIPYSDSDIAQVHLKYWSQYGITQSILEKFDIALLSLEVYMV